MERTLYNGLISGVSLDGKTFFYPNPLESNGQHQRSPWFGVACCPGNITRFLPSVPGYVYAQQGDTLYVNLFVAEHAPTSKLDGGRTVTLVQETRYPWDGAVKITVDARTGRRRFAINVRIPGWARNEPVPSDLYRFVDAVGEPVDAQGQRPGRAARRSTRATSRIDRAWKAGDVDRARLCRCRSAASSRTTQVAADRGRVALQRGPIVYAAEWPDNPNGKVRNIVLPDDDAADDRVPARPARTACRSIKGTRHRLWPTTRRARSTQQRAGLHGDPVLRVGEPRPRADGGLAPPTDDERAAPAAARRWPRRATVTSSHGGQEPAHHQRQERAALVATLRLLLRLVAREGQHGVGRASVRRRRRPSPRSRSTGSTTPAAAAPRARVVAPPLQGRRRVEAGRGQGAYGVAKDAYNRVTFTPVTTPRCASR